jgi:hypothetical protein
MSCGCVIPSHTTRVLKLGRDEEEVARVFTWWCVGMYAHLAPPLVFIEQANELPHRSPISTIIQLGSNLCRP